METKSRLKTEIFLSPRFLTMFGAGISVVSLLMSSYLITQLNSEGEMLQATINDKKLTKESSFRYGTLSEESLNQYSLHTTILYTSVDKKWYKLIRRQSLKYIEVAYQYQCLSIPGRYDDYGHRKEWEKKYKKALEGDEISLKLIFKDISSMKIERNEMVDSIDREVLGLENRKEVVSGRTNFYSNLAICLQIFGLIVVLMKDIKTTADNED